MVAPRGFTEPLRVAENAATLVADMGYDGRSWGGGGRGCSCSVCVGVGVGDALTTMTVPTMLQHPPCGTQ